jgi:hypothetical protein
LYFGNFVGWFLWAPCATHELHTVELMSDTINECVHRWMKRPDLRPHFEIKTCCHMHHDQQAYYWIKAYCFPDTNGLRSQVPMPQEEMPEVGWEPRLPCFSHYAHHFTLPFEERGVVHRVTERFCHSYSYTNSPPHPNGENIVYLGYPFTFASKGPPLPWQMPSGVARQISPSRSYQRERHEGWDGVPLLVGNLGT